MTFFSDLFEGKNYGNLCKKKSLLSFIDSNLKFLKVLKAEYECARARLNQREFGLRNFPNTLNPYIKTKCGSSHNYVSLGMLAFYYLFQSRTL
ncbi:hypothetical protein LEP1GSC169_0464 [Leptospira santarosai str. HAI1349]|nr:hypothetical protein LEP1GSC169_0464 [Leptospira santarosai str. HAI1349]